MIDTPFGASPFDTQEVVDRVGCCRGNTSRKVVAVAERTVNAAVADPTLWAPSATDTKGLDKAARAFTDFVIVAGDLAKPDRKAFRRWVQKMLESRHR